MLKTKFITLSDITIAYSEYGSGPNLILLHGNSLDKSLFHHWQTGFLNNFHTYAIDSRGHGESKSTDTHYTYEQFADDTIRFCESLNITQTFLIGYSDGANTGLFLGKKAPELFQRMILISPEYSPCGTKLFPRLGMRLLSSFFTILAKMRIDGRMAKRFELMLNDFNLKTDDLRDIQSKMLILYAQFDIIYEDHIQEIHSLIPGSELVKIPQCGHMTILLKQQLHEEIHRFLEKYVEPKSN